MTPISRLQWKQTPHFIWGSSCRNRMARTGSKEHEAAVQEVLKEMESEGYRVINLQGKSPDGIAFKEGRVLAVEVLTQRRRWNGKMKFDGGHTIAGKNRDYMTLGFDEVRFKTIMKERVH